MRREIARVELVKDGQSARSLLTDNPTSGIVRAVVDRAEEVRFDEPQAGLEVASAALEAVARLADRDRRPSLQAYAWSVYGSACRGVERYEEAEFGLARAAELIPRRDKKGRADIARRLATNRRAVGLLRPRGHEEVLGIRMVEVPAAVPRRDGHKSGNVVAILDEDAMDGLTGAELREWLKPLAIS